MRITIDFFICIMRCKSKNALHRISHAAVSVIVFVSFLIALRKLYLKDATSALRQIFFSPSVSNYCSQERKFRVFVVYAVPRQKRIAPHFAQRILAKEKYVKN
jgi:hypothetical protein